MKQYPCELSDPHGWENLPAFKQPPSHESIRQHLSLLIELGADIGKATSPASASGARDFDGMRFTSSGHFSAIGARSWRLTRPDLKGSMITCIRSISLDLQRPSLIRAGISATANMSCQLVVSVARHGTQPYEGGRGTLKIETSKSHAYQLSKQFSRCHGAYRIQIDVLSKQHDTPLEIVAEQVYLFADPVQYVEEERGNRNISLAEENKLFRDGHPKKAMALYLALGIRYPLSLYEENYNLALKRQSVFGTENRPPRSLTSPVRNFQQEL